MKKIDITFAEFLCVSFTTLAIIAAIFTGCAQKEIQYVDRPVKVEVPVKCQAPNPKVPSFDGNYAVKVKSIKEYVLEQRAAIKACK
jgi:hypothetical protein